jgi:hypothetical protein
MRYEQDASPTRNSYRDLSILLARMIRIVERERHLIEEDGGGLGE